ncbi:MAG: DeoR/GlpR family DNA-binding transcription regulator [Clostridiales bacterium]|nr:DeoR/GlpR family DNA-binding transcription regulator [Clostridiales bacterium]
MLSAKERQDYIVNQVIENGTVQVFSLSEELECSMVTIRNDIRKLDEMGLIKKVHGGAERRNDGLTVSFEQGESFLHMEEKRRIAEHAYSYIKNRDSLIIDDSTSGYYLAQVIRGKPEKHVSVVTNSILVAAELSSVEHVELFIVSGYIQGRPPAALDNFTIEAFRQFNVAKAFIGASGINLNLGIASLGAAQRDVKKAIIDSAHEVYVLADYTKFSGGFLFTACQMSEVTCVITDKQIDQDIVRQARNLKIRMDVV